MHRLLLTRRMRIYAAIALLAMGGIGTNMLIKAPTRIPEESPLFLALLFFVPIGGLLFSVWIAHELDEKILGHALLHASGDRARAAVAYLKAFSQVFAITVAGALVVGFVCQALAPQGPELPPWWAGIPLTLVLSLTNTVLAVWFALLTRRVSSTLLLSLVAIAVPVAVIVLFEMMAIPGWVQEALNWAPLVGIMLSTGADWNLAAGAVWGCLIALAVWKRWTTMEIL